MFLNTRGDRHRISRALANLLDYMNGQAPMDDFTSRLQAEVELQRVDDGKRDLYMTYNQTLMEMEAKGLQKGIQQGLQKGMQQGLQQGMQQGLQQGQDILAAMQAWLQDNNRETELRQTIRDKEFREKMLAEYQAAMQDKK